jgi:hypothetical protein
MVLFLTLLKSLTLGKSPWIHGDPMVLFLTLLKSERINLTRKSDTA